MCYSLIFSSPKPYEVIIVFIVQMMKFKIIQLKLLLPTIYRWLPRKPSCPIVSSLRSLLLHFSSYKSVGLTWG